MKAGTGLCCTALALALVCAACSGGEDASDAAQTAAPSAASEQAAEQAAAAFDAAVAAENWQLAKAQGDVLIAQYPDSAAARRIAPQHAEAKAKAGAAREDARMAGLWSYNSEPVKGGSQLSAAIYAKEDLDTDGSGAGTNATQVRLIFRDHPDWGRSAYLTLQAGDFDCYGGCRVQVAVDGGQAKSMAASRPDTDEAIAMFIEDERALWRLARDAKTLSIEFPTKAVGKKTAVFEVVGLDRTKLPGWD